MPKRSQTPTIPKMRITPQVLLSPSNDTHVSSKTTDARIYIYSSSIESLSIFFQSLQYPNQLRLAHCDRCLGASVAVGITVPIRVGDGSTQIRPNHSFDVQVCFVEVASALEVEALEIGIAGGDVIRWDVDLAVVVSLHPKNPGVSHTCVEVDAGGGVVVGSLHPPKKPGDLQEVVEVCSDDVFVAVGTNDALLLVVVVVISSLQPNQPGVLQLDVDDVVVVTSLVVVAPLVVLSSRQPHHPGVLQVSVRVRVFVEIELEELVGSELLLL